MKKILAIVLVLVMGLALVACGEPADVGSGSTTDTGGSPPADTSKPAENPPPVQQPNSPPPGQAAPPPAPGVDGTDLILITDLGTIDDRSFNQGSWEGLVHYAVENGISHDYIQPAAQSDDDYLIAIDLGVKMGAKVIVTPGFLFEYPIHTAQRIYPAVHFILIDGTPHKGDYVPDIKENTVGITYAEEQSGFLAGYAAVMDGYTKLGFMGGMAVPAVVRFGIGYVQGAEAAAQELGLPDGAISMNYYYTGVFWPLPEILTMASAWYNDGVEVIFACGGAIFDSIFPAAEQAGKAAIGVDVDQSNLSDAVITSAMKQLSKSVYDKLDEFYKGTFPGGQHIIYDAANGGVGLPMENSKFNTFSQAQYDAIYAKLASGAVVVDNNIELQPDQIPGAKVSVNFMK